MGERDAARVFWRVAWALGLLLVVGFALSGCAALGSAVGIGPPLTPEQEAAVRHAINSAVGIAGGLLPPPWNILATSLGSVAASVLGVQTVRQRTRRRELGKRDAAIEDLRKKMERN